MPALNIAMRFLHIISAITLLGGIFAWRFGLIPALAPLGEDTRRKVDNAVAAAWRPFVLFGVAGLLISGVYNFLNKTGLTPAYHAVIGVKFLLVLHVFAVAILATKPDNAKRARQLTGVAASGVVIVILSAVLRWILT
jgi:uncharacterized membrane protein